MKEMLLACVLIFAAACAVPTPEGEEAAQSHEMAVGSDVDEVVEVPPEGSLPLSEIIANMEVAGHMVITEVEFEDGVWEVEFVVGDEEYQLEIDPVTGEALSDEPNPADDD